MLKPPDGFKVITINPGRSVVCDWCSKDFTDSTEIGGFLFQSKATGPCCVDRIRKSAAHFNEERFIMAECPAGMSFADWVRNELR